MSLADALHLANASLRSLTLQTGVVTTNIANARNPDHARRTAVVDSGPDTLRTVDIRRATNLALERASTVARSEASARSTTAEGLERLRKDLLGVDNEASLQTHVGTLGNALQSWSASPGDRMLAAGAISAGAELATRLNEVADTVRAARATADDAIAGDVARLNDLLARFGEENAAVVSDVRLGRDASGRIDARAALVNEIATIVPVRILDRSGGDMVLTTTGGATLFETVARPVAFRTMADLSTGTTAASVMVDGVPLSSAVAGPGKPGGTIAGHLALRDRILPSVQAQVDEMARGLVLAFAETDQSGAGLPPLSGLFTLAGGPLPSSGALVPGAATTIRIDARFDPDQSGNAMLLRDGGANGPAYRATGAGHPGFADRLVSLLGGFDVPVAFDPAGSAGAASLSAHAAGMTGWLEGERAAASKASGSAGALSTQLAQSLSAETGVSIDHEMSTLLDLERSYEASARIIAAVDGMLATLLDLAR